MKIILICAFFALAAAYDPELLLDDNDEFRVVIACLVDKEPCSDGDEDFKSTLELIIQDACEICDEGVKEAVKIFFESFKYNAPEDYEIYKEKYDPEDKYMKALEENLYN